MTDNMDSVPADQEGATKSEQALVQAVQDSDTKRDVQDGIHSHKHPLWLTKLVPGIEKVSETVTVHAHAGNFVALRVPGKPPGSEKFFESMPIYARLGMHLLFYGKEQTKFLESNHLEKMFKEQSIKQGIVYDKPESVHSIPSFIHTYKIDLNELAQPDISSYKTFNEFFYRKLKDGARPLENPDKAFCSAADCRLTVYPTITEAQKIWIKGDEFTIQRLLHDTSQETTEGIDSKDASIAIFRLAPADYHRFHCPLDGEIVGEPTDIAGTYYTVNPQAVNEVNFDVFTANKRSVIYIKHAGTGQVIAFVAVGALLVGSITWTAKAGDTVQRGQELGYFAYGGSTVIAIFPQGLIKFDDDLLTNSEHKLETLVKVGSSLGSTPA